MHASPFLASLLVLLPLGTLDAQSGRTFSQSFPGPVTGRLVPYTIYLPPGYDQSTERYPVVYHLHGLGGRHDGNDTRTVPDAFETAFQQGLLDPVILVFPDGYGDSMWSDSYDLAKPAETNLVHELIPHIDATYRTRASWEFRVVQGFSMGGYGAAKLAVKFPQLFCSAVLYDGALHTWETLSANRPEIVSGIFGNDRTYFDLHSPYYWAERNAERLRRGLSMRQVVGALTDYNRTWRDHVLNSNLPLEYVETGLPHFLRFLLNSQGSASARFIQEEYPLEGHWSFDEGAGNTLGDASGNAFDGTLVNSPQWTAGVRGGALRFDGQGRYVRIEDANGHPDAIGNLAEGSISLWFQYHSVTGPNEIHPILYLGDGIGGSENSSLIVEVGHFDAGNARVYFTVLYDDGAIRLCFDSRFPLQRDRWYHLTVVVGANFNTGYLNGVEMVKDAANPPARHYNFGDESVRQFFADVLDRRHMWLGRGFLGTIPTDQFLDGTIDEVRIYDRPLAAEEVRELHDRTAFGVTYLGNGTPGSGDLLPVLSTLGGVPRIGNANFALELHRALGGAPAVISFAAARGGLPVPALALNLHGSPPWIFVPGLAQGTPLPGAGSFRLPLPIPLDPALVDADLYSQGVLVDPGAPRGFAASRGLRVTVR